MRNYQSSRERYINPLCCRHFFPSSHHSNQHSNQQLHSSTKQPNFCFSKPTQTFKMLSKTYIVSFLLAAATSVAARPDVQLFNTANCAPNTEGATFGPIPTDRCQTISGNALGAKVRGAVAASCTCKSSLTYCLPHSPFSHRSKMAD